MAAHPHPSLIATGGSSFPPVLMAAPTYKRDPPRISFKIDPIT